MTVEDLCEVLPIEQKTFSEPWSEQVFRDELGATHRSYLVARDDDTIVGYAGLMVVGDDGHVTTIAVDTDARRAAIGTRLLLRLIDRAVEGGATHLTLEVRASNAHAQRF